MFEVGDKRDQLWMEVLRFGFGRDVSGSTFSEGSSLSKEDDVAYWGQIYKIDSASKENDDVVDGSTSTRSDRAKIEINGSVMFGMDLEPCSIARFTMIEKTEEENYEEDDDDDDLDDLDDLDEGIGSFE